MNSIAHRIGLVVLPALVLALSPAWGQEPVPPVDPSQSEPAPQTAPSSQTQPTVRGSVFFTIGLGPGGGGTEVFQAKMPTLLLQLGGTIPAGRKLWTDLALGFSIASYQEENPETTWTGDALLRAAYLTASLRAGRPGKKLGVFGSAGAGLAYVALGEPGGFGVYPEPVGSTTAPVLTGAITLEHPGRKSRLVIELRYSDIQADLGADAGGTLNAGGAVLLFGFRSGL